jgi:hypothetical protein
MKCPAERVSRSPGGSVSDSMTTFASHAGQARHGCLTARSPGGSVRMMTFAKFSHPCGLSKLCERVEHHRGDLFAGLHAGGLEFLAEA